MELYFSDTVKCELGLNSTCAMKDLLRTGPRCARCGWNKNVHKKRLDKLEEEGLHEFPNGLRGLAL